ncbi:hypothetical protein LINPERPRIM_LOCUS18115 [Linum perenne]
MRDIMRNHSSIGVSFISRGLSSIADWIAKDAVSLTLFPNWVEIIASNVRSFVTVFYP